MNGLKMITSNSEIDYLHAVARLKQYLMESESTDRSIFSTGSKKDEHDFDPDISVRSKTPKSKRAIFHCSTPKAAQPRFPDEVSNEQQLLTLIQRQFIYIGSLEKEVQFLRKEANSLSFEFKSFIEEVLGKNAEESKRLTESLFSVLTSLAGREVEIPPQAKEEKLQVELASVERQLSQLKETYMNHKCSATESEASQLLQNFRREELKWHETEERLRNAIGVLQQRETDALQQVQQSVEVAEQAQVERAQMEKEVHRLAELVEHQEKRLAELSGELTRQDQKYVDQLNSVVRERDLRDEAITRMSVDLERIQRAELNLKNELQLKNTLLDNTRQELQRQLGQLQSELSRAAGHHAELQRRLGEAELRAELSGKSCAQEAALARSELDLWRRKAELLEKELDCEKSDRQKVTDELAQKIRELRMLTPAAEEEKARLLRYNAQMQSVARFFEQREVSLLSALQTAEKQSAKRIDEYARIVEEQRAIIEKLRSECGSLADSLETYVLENNEARDRLERELNILTTKNKSAEEQYEIILRKNQFLVQELLRITRDNPAERA